MLRGRAASLRCRTDRLRCRAASLRYRTDPLRGRATSPRYRTARDFRLATEKTPDSPPKSTVKPPAPPRFPAEMFHNTRRKNVARHSNVERSPSHGSRTFCLFEASKLDFGKSIYVAYFSAPSGGRAFTSFTFVLLSKVATGCNLRRASGVSKMIVLMGAVKESVAETDTIHARGTAIQQKDSQ